MKRGTMAWISMTLTLFALVLGAFPSPLLAQTIQVTSATPNTGAQGTLNLNVAIAGKGFKNGARAVFYLTGTTNPAGITVNATAFNTSNQVTANINISDTASISSFDVVVQNTDGRSGKGTKLFSVTAKGAPTGCTTLGTPSGYTLVTPLNYATPSGAAQYQPHLGTTIIVRPATLTDGAQSRAVQIAAVGSGNNSGKMEFFFLDPASGQVLDGTAIVGTHVQPHITVQFDPTATVATRAVAAGDVNGDGIPDFVGGDAYTAQAYVFLSGMDQNGVVSYGPVIFLIKPPAYLTAFGNGVAVGNLDGGTGDEIAVGGTGGKVKGATIVGEVFVYKFDGSGMSLLQTVAGPAPNLGGFGSSVAIGDVTGDGVPDLVVGTGVNVYVFPSPLTSTTNFTLTTGSEDGFGWGVGIGSLSSSTAQDVIAVNQTWGTPTNPRVMVFGGPITGNRAGSSFDFLPNPTYTNGWGTHWDTGDMTGDGRLDVLVGAPNATSTICGTASLFQSNPSNPAQPTLTMFEAPTTGGGFSYSVGIAPYLPGDASLLLVGANGRDVGSTTAAGQVFVYKKN